MKQTYRQAVTELRAMISDPEALYTDGEDDWLLDNLLEAIDDDMDVPKDYGAQGGAVMTYQKMYRITRGSQGGYYDHACQQMCGLYRTLDAAREQIPDDWVRDDETDAERDGEAYYMPGTIVDDMDGYGHLVVIMMEPVDLED